MRKTPSSKILAPEISALFKRAYDEFHSQFHLEKDPIYHVHRFTTPGDQEVIALLSSILAYGNVATILSSVYKAADPLGDQPKLLIQKGFSKNPLPYFRHRFTTGEDIWVIFERLKAIYERYETLEDFYLEGATDSRMEVMLSRFVDRFFAVPVSGKIAAVEKRRMRSLRYLLPHPARGSACKRLNLFMRWMVRRKDGIDLGLWMKVNPNTLLLPVDTHLLKLLRELRWTSSKVANWKVAEAATIELRKISPEDPIRYDFSLCHLSMSRLSIKTYQQGKMSE